MGACLIVVAGGFSLACGSSEREATSNEGGGNGGASAGNGGAGAGNANGGSIAGSGNGGTGAGGGGGGMSGQGGTGVTPPDRPFVIGSYTLAFDRMEYAGTPTTTFSFQSLGKSIFVALREEPNVTSALVSTETRVERYIEADASVSAITIDYEMGLPFGEGDLVEHWTQIVLGRRSGGALDGTFHATGTQTYTLSTPGGGGPVTTNDVTGTGRLARDIDAPLFSVHTTGAVMPWTTIRIGYNEPVSRSAFEALEVTLPSPLGTMLLGDFVEENADPVFGSARRAAFQLPSELSWAEVSGAVVIDARSVRDLGGLATANPDHSIAVSAVGAARTTQAMDSLAGLAVEGNVSLATAGSASELCENAGCVALGCGDRLAGLLDASTATSITLRHRARGLGMRIIDPGGYQMPGGALFLTRRGGDSATTRAMLTGDMATGALDEAWHDEVVPLPTGTSGEIGFELSADCVAGASITWVVDSIDVAR